MKNIELLAPAGSFETMEAAFAAGADAVYIGGTRFGARAYADNPDAKQMLSAIDYAHLHGKRLYMTINTLFKEKELREELYDYLLPCYEQGLDAVIVQDFGVLRFVKKYFPDLHIHASTQMTITGSAGAKLLEEQGVQRIVTARELSLEEITEIHRTTGLEIESFVHGALCYCYSGQCLFSSILGGRSGNRGRCAQPCRLPYEVYEKNKRLNDTKSSYVLSPKDMCTVELLPQILKAGVTSLKIEGRMKKPEYTAGVVEVYRKYLDLYAKDPAHYRVERTDLQRLYDLYNRDGFNQSYYQVRNGKAMMAMQNLKKTEDGEDIRTGRNEALIAEIRQNYMEKKKQEKIRGFLTLLNGSPAILTVQLGEHWITVEKDCVSPAEKQPMSRERIEKQLKKTGNTPFVFEELDITMEENIFVPLQALNELRREALEQLEQEVLAGFRRTALPKPEDCFSKGEVKAAPKLYALAETAEQVEALLTEPDIYGIYAGMTGITEHLEAQMELWLLRAKEQKKELWLLLPQMVRQGELNPYRSMFHRLLEKGLVGFLARNLESFAVLKEEGLAEKTRLDANLYTLNTEAQAFWNEQGIAGDTVPLELNEREIRQRDNTQSDFLIYGYLPMMVSAQCVKKNTDACTKANARVQLKDRKGKFFTASCYCSFCYNVIYNSLPYGLLREEAPVTERLRLNFTLEDAETVKQTVRLFADAYLRHKEVVPKQEYTKGHFKRGVE